MELVIFEPRIKVIVVIYFTTPTSQSNNSSSTYSMKIVLTRDYIDYNSYFPKLNLEFVMQFEELIYELTGFLVQK